MVPAISTVKSCRVVGLLCLVDAYGVYRPFSGWLRCRATKLSLFLRLHFLCFGLGFDGASSGLDL